MIFSIVAVLLYLLSQYGCTRGYIDTRLHISLTIVLLPISILGLFV